MYSNGSSSSSLACSARAASCEPDNSEEEAEGRKARLLGSETGVPVVEENSEKRLQGSGERKMDATVNAGDA